MAERYADAGFTTVVQDIVIGSNLRYLVDRIRHRPLSVVVLVPDAATVAARDRARQHDRGKVAYRDDGPSVAALQRVLLEETPRIGHWLDSSHQTVSETVAEIRANLQTVARVR